MNELEKVEFALYYMHCLWDFDLLDNEKDFKIAQKEWKKLKDLLNDEPWANGKHYGDCINMPLSCHRCVMEEYENIAKRIRGL